MNRIVWVFWGTALGLAVLFAAMVAAFMPYEALRLHTVAERERAWLLTMWTGGVMAILFGLSARLGGFTGLGFRELYEAGSLRAARELQRERLRGARAEFHRSFDWWLMSTGGMLVLIYFGGWLTLR